MHHRVAIGARIHGRCRAHAAIRLEGAALKENGFAGSFFGAGEETADHHAGCAGSNGFGDVTRELDSTIGDDRHAGAFGRPRRIHDRGELGYAGAGYHPGGTDRAWPDADLKAVDPEGDKVARAFVGGNVPGDELHLRQAVTYRLDRFHDPLGVAVGGVDGQHVGLRLSHLHGALQEIAGGANRRANPQAPLLIFRGPGVLQFFLDIFYGDQTF